MYVIEMFENLNGEGESDCWAPSTEHLFYTYESAEAFLNLFVKYMKDGERIAYRIYRTDRPDRLKRIIEKD